MTRTKKALHRAADRKPFLKFYPQSWFGDTALRGCSLAARGLWIDLLMVMHQDGEPYGYLARDGKPIPDGELAQLCGVPLETYPALLGELEARKVFSRDVKGRVYSRKMLRDSARAKAAAGHGRTAVDHPNHPSHRRHTLKGHPIPQVEGSPEGQPEGSPFTTRALERSRAFTDLSEVPRATPDDLAARDDIRAAWGKV